MRFEIRDPSHMLERARTGEPAIFACRHGQLLPLLWAVEDCELSIVVSQSLDGELLANVLRRRGFGIIRGSSSRDGRMAAREALRVLRAGGRIGLAVDGPRGPRGQVQVGTLRIARSADVPIVPLWARVSGAWVAPGSWDQFEVPWPGAHVRAMVGAPLRVGRGTEALAWAGRRLAQAVGGWWEDPTAQPVGPGIGRPKELHGSAG
jgi:lysophospholipid acyltransferase (LPLAT)-like uncharacterized protein